MKPIAIWGGKGHAKVLAEFMGSLGYEVVAIFDNDPNVPTPVQGVPIYYGKQGFLTWRNQNEFDCAGLVAIGGDRGHDRLALQGFLASHGLRTINAIHPTAYIATDAVLAAGVQVLIRAVICSDAKIGDGTIINTAATIDHECVLGAAVHVGPGANLAGCVTVGDFSFIGTGAVVLPRVQIGQDALIGAGAVVTRSIPDFAVAYGNPARVTRLRTPE